MGVFPHSGGRRDRDAEQSGPPPDMSAAGNSPVKDVVSSKEEVKHESHQMAG